MKAVRTNRRFRSMSAIRCARRAAAKTRQQARGFTLIELMAAMAVFSILLVMLLRVFTGSVKTFHAGTGLSKQTSEARLVLDHIAQLMQDNNFELKRNGESELKFWDADDCDITAVPQDILYVDQHGPPLNGGAKAIKLLQKHDSPASDVPLLDHVVEFKVSVYDETMLPINAATMNGLEEFPIAGGVNACSNAPVVAVIYLETLSDRQARIAANLGATYDKSLYSQKYYRTVYLRRFLLNE